MSDVWATRPARVDGSGVAAWSGQYASRRLLIFQAHVTVTLPDLRLRTAIASVHNVSRSERLLGGWHLPGLLRLRGVDRSCGRLE